MSAKKAKKVRVAFRKNRTGRARNNDLTREYDHESFDGDATTAAERISGKGNLSRYRTVISEERAEDGTVLPSVDTEACMEGRVIRVHGLNSTVETGDGRLYTCTTRRILKTLSTDQRHVVVAGDRVLFRDAEQPNRLEGMIERIEPRTGTLCRTSRYRKHVIVSNIDQVLIVSSAAEPDFKPNLIDRMLLTTEQAGLLPVIVVNKVDLVDPAELQPVVGVYAQMGYRVLLVSVKTGMGIDRLRRLMRNRESVVSGQSGVGKSSLLNAIDPGLDLRVGDIGTANKGTHTTTTAELIRLSGGGYVVDTPGLRQFMLWDIIPEEVAGLFRDLRPYEHLCRFPDCTHSHEDGCAIKNAVADGRLDLRRYESYLVLRGT
ncbi:MAG TPA: ribosome small subunit-dependent GTPase A [Planctomycetaceae bacterium]|nr:ribosome small subunit-dependent GTPase A [Planctomycetaceae bacterium]